MAEEDRNSGTRPVLAVVRQHVRDQASRGAPPGRVGERGLHKHSVEILVGERGAVGFPKVVDPPQDDPGGVPGDCGRRACASAVDVAVELAAQARRGGSQTGCPSRNGDRELVLAGRRRLPAYRLTPAWEQEVGVDGPVDAGRQRAEHIRQGAVAQRTLSTAAADGEGARCVTAPAHDRSISSATHHAATSLA
jgi:hypothetical protein